MDSEGVVARMRDIWVRVRVDGEEEDEDEGEGAIWV